jgi:hypothetical protein
MTSKDDVILTEIDPAFIKKADFHSRQFVVLTAGVDIQRRQCEIRRSP